MMPLPPPPPPRRAMTMGRSPAAALLRGGILLALLGCRALVEIKPQPLLVARASGLMKALQTLRIVETRWAACFCRGAQ